MISKSILNKISELEEKYSITEFNIEECAGHVIETIEAILKYEVRSRIKLEKKYSQKDNLEKSILSFLTIEELRKIAYYSCDKNEE